MTCSYPHARMHPKFFRPLRSACQVSRRTGNRGRAHEEAAVIAYPHAQVRCSAATMTRKRLTPSSFKTETRISTGTPLFDEQDVMVRSVHELPAHTAEDARFNARLSLCAESNNRRSDFGRCLLDARRWVSLFQ